MKLVIMILKDEELLNDILKTCTNANIKNITVLDSDSYECEKGSRRKRNDVTIFNSIRYILNYYNDESRTLLVPMLGEKLDEFKAIIKEIVPSTAYTLMVINLEELIGLEK